MALTLPPVIGNPTSAAAALIPVIASPWCGKLPVGAGLLQQFTFDARCHGQRVSTNVPAWYIGPAGATIPMCCYRRRLRPAAATITLPMVVRSGVTPK